MAVATKLPEVDPKVMILSDVPDQFINVRSGPGAGFEDLGDLVVGDRVLYYKDPNISDWVGIVRFEGALVGWTSLQGGKVKFLEQVSGGEPPTTTPQLVTQEQVNDLKAKYANLMTSWDSLADTVATITSKATT